MQESWFCSMPIQPGKPFQATATNYKVPLTSEVDFLTTNICYAITYWVTRCAQQWIVQTIWEIQSTLRVCGQKCGSNWKAFQPTWGHSKSDMGVTFFEKIHSKYVWFREELESTQEKQTVFYKGMNLKQIFSYYIKGLVTKALAFLSPFSFYTLTYT